MDYFNTVDFVGMLLRGLDARSHVYEGEQHKLLIRLASRNYHHLQDDKSPHLHYLFLSLLKVTVIQARTI